MGLKQPNQHTLAAIDLRTVEVRPRRLLRYSDCAADINSSRNHIYNIVKSGKLQAYELDGLKFIRAADWDRYLDTAEPITPKKRISAALTA